MTKWVIDTVELIKKQYVVEAYSNDEAIDKMEVTAPTTNESLNETIYSIQPINEYEYNKDWVGNKEELGTKGSQEEDHSNDTWHSRTGGGGFGTTFGRTGGTNNDWVEEASDREGNGK